MPKMYSEKEKEEIVKSLKGAASDCMKTYGVKKTTVDELVRRVGIPKGTFYLFYKSKELLLFDTIMELHDQIESGILQELQRLKDHITVESYTQLVLSYFLKVSDTCFYNIMLSGEMDILIRKLPDEVVSAHKIHDEENLKKILGMLQVEDADIKAFSGAFRGAFLALQYHREIGEENFVESIRLIIRGLILQVMEGNNDTSREC